MKCPGWMAGGHALLTRIRAPHVPRSPRPADLVVVLGPLHAESLAESAAAYTKATAWTCLLEKVEVITGEEAESNVLQVRASVLSRAARSGLHNKT